MSIDWTGIILDSQSPETAWASIFSSLLDLAKQSSSPVALHDATVIPDRLLSEAAWELWESYPEHAVKTSAMLKDWTSQGSGKAVLILDALSLRELPILLSAAAVRGVDSPASKCHRVGMPLNDGSICKGHWTCFPKCFGR